MKAFVIDATWDPRPEYTPSPVEIEPVADSAFDEPRMDLLLGKIVERLAAQFHVSRVAILLRASKAGDLGTGIYGWKRALNAFAIHFPGRLPLQ